MSGERALHRALADACLGRRGAGELTRDLRGFLDAHGVDEQDVSAILAAPARFAVYRSLVRNGLSAVVLRMLPRTRSRMNAACDGGFDADLARFVDEVGPRSHYLRDVPTELFGWAEERWRADARVPAYLPDLAAHELAIFAVAAADSAGAPARPGDAALDRPLLFTGSMRLARYAWAVHELPGDEDARDEPARRDVSLLAYRDHEHVVRWLELTPLAASILGRLAEGAALGAAIVEAGAPSSALDEIARLLADLAERGVLLGAREGD